ncbi:MAG: nucleoside triphosphate pyrophosphohydrolase [Desulfobacterales bacterium]|nr:MAG: nucleoside triphosphate pyrophosphohydrolase [Desulfobacterales bacterium]
MDQLAELTGIIRRLRGENGCPWDRRQTPEKMAVYLVEEAHELMQAISTGNGDHIREELGDVLFQILFIAELYREKGAFSLDEAAAASTGKMIRRHPHVFGDASAEDPEAVRRQWHEIKQRERKAHPPASVMDSVPQSLPPITRAYRISERAVRTGFDWDDAAGVMKKAEEEWREFRTEVRAVERAETGAPDRKKESASAERTALEKASMEFGDLLFTLVNVARMTGVHPDCALSAATRKFEDRFKDMEAAAAASGRAIDQVPRTEKEVLWEEAKTRHP